jgi:deoxycytidine triphosphate deaminase
MCPSDVAAWITAVTCSVLSDGTIRRLVDEGRIKIDPWDPGMVQPASVDLRLGTSFRVFHNHRIKAVDLGAPPSGLTELLEVEQDGDFVIHPTEFVLGRTKEMVELPDDVVARIEGKALALDTPVPTPGGWTTMGELEVGSEVFDAWGVPTTVVAATEVMIGRECREVAFSDGTRIVADVDHLWESWTKRSRANRRAPEIVTTGQIERTLKADDSEYSHLVTTADPPILHEPEFAGRGVGHRGTSAMGVLGRTMIRAERLPGSRRHRRKLAIVDVRRVASVPVRCVQVAHPRGLFLVSGSFIPTHNSSLGRLGLIVHATAGFVDPGFRGSLTLEITNFNSVPIVLRPGLPIAQLSFMALDRPAQRPYGHPELGSHYHGQTEATESRYEGGPAERSLRK